MSSQRRPLLSSSSSAGSLAASEIHHLQSLSLDMAELCNNEHYSDVTLLIEGRRVPAHKVILAARSEYFRALLYGGMRESAEEVIELKEASVEAFSYVLKYLYAGCLSLSTIREDLVLDILGLAHQYSITNLEAAICDHLRTNLSLDSVCAIYDTAVIFQLDNLIETALAFIDKHAIETMKHETFKELSSDAVKSMISRDSFYAPENEVFKSVCDWAAGNPETTELPSILGVVRFPLLTRLDLVTTVRDSGLVSPDMILDAIALKETMKETQLKHRGIIRPDENVATIRFGATVLEGEMRSHLLDGDTSNYDMERGFTRHPIDDGNRGILVKLGAPHILNHFKLLLWDRDLRMYSYYIEVSTDQQEWTKVINHTSVHCRSWQYLYFPERVIRYIRIVGTMNTVNRVFHAVAFEACYSTAIPKLENGVIVPNYNVASVNLSATVIEGVSRTRNALINESFTNYDWDSGYTCHQIGTGALVIHLGQPYFADSMRLLLWDCDDRRYSFYVEVSNNQRDWTVVHDKTREGCRSWQTMRFEKRSFCYVRIVGTHNTANDVFHCVHFECPSQVLEPETEPIDDQLPAVSQDPLVEETIPEPPDFGLQ